MKDIFELAKEEKEAKNNRIAQVLCGGLPRGTDKDFRECVAQELYSARYEGHTWEEKVEAEEVLENFCWNIFGASFDEVLKAWDGYLG